MDRKAKIFKFLVIFVTGLLLVAIEPGLNHSVILHAQEAVEKWPWLGVGMDNLPSPNGIKVTSVDTSGPAYSAGLKPGDIIRKIDQTQITDSDQFLSVLRSYEIGGKVTLTVEEDGKQKAASVILRKWPNYLIHYNKALEFIKHEQAEEAILLLKKAILQNPNYANAHNVLGLLYQHKKQWDDAIKEFRETIRGDKKFVLAYHNLGRAYEELGKFDEAIQYHRKAVELDSNNAEYHFRLGYSYFVSGQSEEATKVFNKMIKSNQKDARAHIFLGLLYQQKKQWDDTIKKFRDAIRSDTLNVYAYHYLGKVYEELGKFDEAIQYHLKTVELDSNNNEYYFRLGYSYGNIGQYQQAIQAYKETIKLNPQAVGAHNNLGVAYYNLGKEFWDKAIEHYQLAIQVNPKYALAHNNLGDIYKIQARLDSAATYYLRALEKFEKDKDNYWYVKDYIEIGEEFHEKKEHEKALTIFENGYKYRVEPEYLLRAAWCNLNLNRKETALQKLKKVLKDNPKDRAALSSLVVIYGFHINDLRSAQKYYKQFIASTKKEGDETSLTFLTTEHEILWEHFIPLQEMNEEIEKGDLALKKGDPIQAILHYKKSQRKYDSFHENPWSVMQDDLIALSLDISKIHSLIEQHKDKINNRIKSGYEEIAQQINLGLLKSADNEELDAQYLELAEKIERHLKASLRVIELASDSISKATRYPFVELDSNSFDLILTLDPIKAPGDGTALEAKLLDLKSGRLRKLDIAGYLVEGDENLHRDIVEFLLEPGYYKKLSQEEETTPTITRAIRKSENESIPISQTETYNTMREAIQLGDNFVKSGDNKNAIISFEKAAQAYEEFLESPRFFSRRGKSVPISSLKAIYDTTQVKIEVCRRKEVDKLKIGLIFPDIENIDSKLVEEIKRILIKPSKRYKLANPHSIWRLRDENGFQNYDILIVGKISDDKEARLVRLYSIDLLTQRIISTESLPWNEIETTQTLIPAYVVSKIKNVAVNFRDDESKIRASLGQHYLDLVDQGYISVAEGCEAAVQHFKQAMALDPDSKNLKLQYCRAILKFSDTHFGIDPIVAKEGYQEVLKHYDEIKWKDKNEYTEYAANVYRTLGALLSNQKQFDEAQKYLDRALELALTNEFKAFVYLSLGYMSLNQKNYALALQAFTEGRTLDPNNVYILIGLAEYHRKRKNYYEAIELCEKAIRLDESNYGSYFEKAICHFSLDQLEYAEKWLRKSRTKYPNDPYFDFALANLLYKKGDVDKAISLFLKFSGQTKDKIQRAMVYNNIAEAFVHKGLFESQELNFPQAEEYYKKAQDEFPEDPVPFYGMGVLYDKESRIAESKEMIRKAISLDTSYRLDDLYFEPKSEELYWQALIYEVKGDFGNAILKWKEYLDKIKAEKKHKDQSIERAQEHLRNLTQITYK